MPLTPKSCFELEQIQQGAGREQGSNSYKQNRTTEPQYQVHWAGWKQKGAWYSLYSLQLGEDRRRLYATKKHRPHFFPKWTCKNICWFSLNPCKRGKPLLIPLSSSPPKKARCSSTALQNTGLESSSKPQLQHRPTGAHCLPDDGYELRHGQLLGNKKLGFVQERKVFLFMVSLNNYLFQLESRLAKPKPPRGWSILPPTLRRFREDPNASF